MRRALHLIAVFVLVISFSLNVQSSGSVLAKADESRIKDIIGKNTILLEDGSLWTLDTTWSGAMHTPGDLVAITGGELSGIGITSSGELVSFGPGKPPTKVAGQTGIKQVAGNRWLKSDGTVWTWDGKLKKLEGVHLIGQGSGFGALTKSGDVLLENRYTAGIFRTFNTIPDASSVVSLAVDDNSVALLYDSGKVVVFEEFNFDDNLQVIPVTVAEDAVHIEYVANSPTDALIVTRKDGTVWRTGDYQDRWKLVAQIPGLSQIVKTDSLSSVEQFYAQRSDGSWLLYDEENVIPFDAPSIDKVDAALSDLKPFVNGTIKIDIQETYTNGAKFKVPVSESNVTVQKPYLLKFQSNGTLKALGVGQSQVSVTASGTTKTFTVSISLRNKLKHAKLVNGVVFIPIKPVFEALSGSVATSGGAFDVQLGDTTVSLRTGDKNVKFNDKTLQLKAAPMIVNGETLFPAALLTDVLGARIQWDAKWKQAVITIGSASMTVVSDDTALLVKRAAQGSLAKFIGKSYWINHFQGWERFSKVTITDILPDDTGFYTIVFKTSTGKSLKSYSMAESNVTDLFSNEFAFLSYDPYKKYAWSASVWKQVKAEQVSLGMTKDQVRFSWGTPSTKSISSFAGKTIEVWVYGNFDTVSFVNGKVTMVID
ncbi:stalk domain-containing protein [Cohnella sp. GCM10027633]|uniref:stalk domain-containing protein n=1 Tax=unclassified Cohnella TaxID=2636738 RepID=UPI00363B0510